MVLTFYDSNFVLKFVTFVDWSDDNFVPTLFTRSVDDVIRTGGVVSTDSVPNGNRNYYLKIKNCDRKREFVFKKTFEDEK